MATDQKIGILLGAALSLAALLATAQVQPLSPGVQGAGIPDNLRKKIEERRGGNTQGSEQGGGSSKYQQRYQMQSGQGEATPRGRKLSGQEATSSQGPSGSSESVGAGANPPTLRNRNRDVRKPNVQVEAGQLGEQPNLGEQGGVSKNLQLRERLRSTEPGSQRVGESTQGPGTSNQGGMEKRDVRRSRFEQTPASGSSGESQGSLAEQKRQQLKERLEQLHKKGQQAGEQQTDATPASGTTGRPERLSAEELRKRLEEKRKGQQGTGQEVQGTPSSTGNLQQGRLSREELKRKLEEQRKGTQGQQTTEESATGQVQQGQQGGKQLGERGQRLSRDELRQRLEELRQKKTGQQTPGPGQQGTMSALEERKQKLEQLRQQTEQRKGDLRAQLKPEDREKLRSLYEQSKGKNLRELAQQLRAEQGGQKGTIDREALAAKLQELRRIQGEERSKLIGANLQDRKLALEGRLAGRKFTADDVRRRFGDVQAKPRFELAKQDLELLNRGEVPPRLRPHGDMGLIRRPLEREWRYRHEHWFCPPPPRRHGFGIDLVGFHWEYWDGRHHYDHHWAINIFINIGHVRYDGYDGVIVGGRYFCYGWGWIDGCIDYGDCRIWVPGFWAPYTVTECCECEVWVPPVYDWVWTGCCWEQVLVSGGYFVRQPSGCHTVTRWRWVPGHFEYYRC